MNILITGAAGFIGSNLAKFLIEKDNFVYGIDNFITGRKKNIKALESHPRFKLFEQDLITWDFESVPKCDIIFHLASPASPIQYKRFPIETLMVNSLGTKKVLDFILKNKNSVFVFSSTSEVYGDPEKHPQSESYWGNVNPNGIRSCYDESKRFAESLIMTYFRKYHVNVRIARIFNTYGPQMEQNDGRVVSNFINQALKNQPITVNGDGTQTRSFCYVSDMVKGLYMLGATENISGEVINLGNPSEMTVLELATTIKKLTASHSKIIFTPLDQDDPKKRKPDISKASQLLGWKPGISLEDGLMNTISFFQSQLI